MVYLCLNQKKSIKCESDFVLNRLQNQGGVSRETEQKQCVSSNAIILRDAFNETRHMFKKRGTYIKVVCSSSIIHRCLLAFCNIMHYVPQKKEDGRVDGCIYRRKKSQSKKIHSFHYFYLLNMSCASRSICTATVNILLF